ncbi:MarR family winged helix-turn-helix transcriptional regulator [Microbacterium kunmingense]|uniref:MarR family winged helix-turn-helix transcriptional regulator n=1 Tax=Microbacterium kunmingense TaxID=2915939 RepID=UPI003D75FE3A
MRYDIQNSVAVGDAREDTMNTGSPDTPNIPDRPLGFWLRAADALISREVDTALAAHGSDRREWMVLNALAGDVDARGFRERLSRKPKMLRHLADRGLVAREGDDWTLTAEGRARRDLLAETVTGVRARVAGAVSPEDYRTTIASLEAIARELGFSDDDPRPWRGGPRHPRHRFGLRPFAPGEPRPGDGGGPGPRFGGNPHHGFRGAGPRPDADAV